MQFASFNILRHYLLPVVLLAGLAACRKDAEVTPGDNTDVGADSLRNGFYLLNEGNMGMNLSTLDYYNSGTGIYSSNIYSTINPGATKELGDVGNDLKIYGGKLYAVIAMSDKVDVMDVHTAKRIGQINVPSCRYITFYKDKAYVSSYATVAGGTPGVNGYVAEVDTATLQVIRTVAVGRQPEEMAVTGDKMYVANSGGYSQGHFERTVSVVNLNTFSETKRIDVALNLHHVKADQYGDIYVTSRGNYYDVHSKLYVIDSQKDIVKDSLPTAVSDLWISGDSAFIYGVEWSYVTNKNTVTYSVVDIKNERVLADMFITDGTEKQITTPSGVAVDPTTKEIYVTDAKDNLLPGTLYCFSPAGKKKWSVTAGNIPGHFAFVRR
jgi:YVTN family beta-propeller protein